MNPLTSSTRASNSGGIGYLEDQGVARALRDIRLMNIGAGTTEVMHETINKMIMDSHG